MLLLYHRKPIKKDAHKDKFVFIISSLRRNGWAACGLMSWIFHPKDQRALAQCSSVFFKRVTPRKLRGKVASSADNLLTFYHLLGFLWASCTPPPFFLPQSSSIGFPVLPLPLCYHRMPNPIQFQEVACGGARKKGCSNVLWHSTLQRK